MQAALRRYHTIQDDGRPLISTVIVMTAYLSEILAGYGTMNQIVTVIKIN